VEEAGQLNPPEDPIRATMKGERPMSDSPASLSLQLLFSAAGAGYFIYGRKRRSTVPFVCGLVLMVFPYFLSSTLLIAIVGAALLVVPCFIRL
jgi:hypothetical protein